MSQTPADHKACSNRPPRRFLTTLVCGYSFLFVLTVVIVLAVLAGQEGFRANPPRITWPFTATFLGGTISFALLQLALLYRFKDRDFWPQGGWQWCKRLGLFLPLVLAPVISLLMHPLNNNLAWAAVAMCLGVSLGLVPTSLCLFDWAISRRQVYEETVKLRPLQTADLPRAVCTYFESQSARLIALGFRPLGDFRLKEHTEVYARLFLHRDGDTFAEISYSRLTFFPLRVVCFVSLSPAGHYLESSNVRFFARSRQSKDFELQVLPKLSAEEVFQRHQARLRELDQGHPRQMTLDDLEGVIHYGNKHLYELLEADGVSSRNPYASFDESTLVSREREPRGTVAFPFDSPWDTPNFTDSIA